MSIFNRIRLIKPKRNVIDLSHEVKLSCNFGQLIPFMCLDVVPGDTFQNQTEMLIRVAPMLAPLMHRVNVYTHFFFVPNRLIWDNWEEFITGGEDGQSNIVHPYTVFTNSVDKEGSLADYFNYPTPVGSSGQYSADVLPLRAYELIWNEYYRDQNLQEAIEINKGDGQDLTTSHDIKYRCWEKDYFTSALPWTQRGGEVILPLGTEADVVYNRIPGQMQKLIGSNGTPVAYNGDLRVNDGNLETQVQGAGSDIVDLDPNGTLKADLSEASAVTINELRRASRLQQWLERNAVGGARYIEQIFAHFGVKSSDSRLQRPEFLGGGKQPVMISEVLQTSQTTSGEDASPLAQMAGHGVSVGSSNQFKKFFEEHGWVIGILSIMPRTGYQQGLPRRYRRFDKFDYYFPEFAHLGEQPVYNYELYGANGNGTDMDTVFGYQSRYAEYRYVPSTSHGQFKTTLNYWHLNRVFNNKPVLNEEFVSCDPKKSDLNRIFAVEDVDDHFYVQLYNKLSALRPMPKEVTPTL